MAPLLLMLFFVTRLGARVDYSLADLEVLAQEGSHQEFLLHAMDVRPSERQTKWKELVAQMAQLYARELQSKPTIREADFKKITQLWSWPSLKEDLHFKERRKEVAIKYLKTCLKQDPPCWPEVQTFWESDKTDPEMAYRLAEIVVQHEGSPIPTWNFLEVALKSSTSEFYCKKDFVMDALWAKLDLDYGRLDVKGDFLKKIDSTVHHDCVPVLNAEARIRLYSPRRKGDRELAFQILAAQGKIDSKTEDLFHVVYLLENPSKGQLFNTAWNRLEALGKRPLNRDDMLDMIKRMDPLPDEIFVSMDLPKKRQILSLFKRNFPEYIDFYTSQCLKYYGGKTNFPRGNPTVHCQDLMSSDLAPAIIEQHKIKEYQSIRAI